MSHRAFKILDAGLRQRIDPITSTSRTTMQPYQVIIIAVLTFQAGLYFGAGKSKPISGAALLIAALLMALTFAS
jgi:hypothetical protein